MFLGVVGVGRRRGFEGMVRVSWSWTAPNGRRYQPDAAQLVHSIGGAELPQLMEQIQEVFEDMADFRIAALPTPRLASNGTNYLGRFEIGTLSCPSRGAEMAP